MTILARHPALVLNADYRPLSYVPLSLWPAEDAVRAMVAGRVDVVASYEETISSPSRTIPLPSVIALRDYQSLARPAALTRFNVFMRDDHRCQFCGARFRAEDLTFDHVLPRSRGGRSVFTNLVSACGPCNARKANRTPREAGMPLLREPWHPTLEDLNRVGRKYPPGYLHETWADFCYWDSVLQET